MTLFQQQIMTSKYLIILSQFKLTAIIMKNSFIHSPLTFKEQEDQRFNQTNHLPISHDSSQSLIVHEQDQFTRYCTLAQQSLLKNYQCQMQQLERRSTMNNEKSWERLPGFIHIIIQNLKQLSLTTSSRTEIETLLEPYQVQLQKMIKKIQKNQNGKFGPIKALLSNFFRDYTDLLSRIIDKIGKYHCDKKLKYLIETIVRQIFTEIMRMAYDIQIQSKGLGKNWQRQSALQTFYQIKMIIDKHGQVDRAFKTIKQMYFSQVTEDKRFVKQFQVKINNLQSLHQKIKKRIKSRYIYQWRIKNTVQKQYENHLIGDMNKQITKKIAKVVSTVRDEKQQWKDIFSDKVNESFKQLLAKFLLNNQEIFSQVKQSNMKIKLALKNTDANSPVENKWILNKSIAMQQKLSHNSSVSSLMSSQISYRSEAISVCYNKLNKCVQQRQIQCYSIPNEEQKQCIMIPIGDMGVIQIIWNGNYMISIHVFQFLLKAIQNSCQLISEGYYLSSVLQELSIKIVNNSWEKQMFQQYTHQTQKQTYTQPLLPKKSKILIQDIECIPEESYLEDKLSMYWENDTKNYYKEQNFNSQKNVNLLQSKLNTQNSDFDVQKWLETFKIAEISIYHTQDQTEENKNNYQEVINPCFDWKDSMPLSKQVAFAIKKQLEFKASKGEPEIVKISKSNKHIYAIRTQKGFCKFVMQQDSNENADTIQNKIKNFLIPLILNKQGNIQKCRKCRQYQPFKLNLKVLEDAQQNTKSLNIFKLFESASFYKLLTTDNIIELEKTVYSCLSELIPSKIYSRIIYLIDHEKQWVLDSKCSRIIQLLPLSLSPSQSEINSQNPYYSYLKSLLKEHPLFQFSELQNYQNQYSEHFSIFYAISKKTIILLGTYKKQQQQLANYCELLNEISSFIKYNNHAINKGSIGQWTDKIMSIKQQNEVIHNSFRDKLSQHHQLQFVEHWQQKITNYAKSYLPESPSINFYKVTTSSIRCLNTNEIMITDDIIQQLPDILFSHSAVLNQNLILNLKSNNRKNRLKDKQLYFPNFSKREKQLWDNINQILMRNYQSQSKVMEQRYQQVENILKIQQMDEIQQRSSSHRKYQQKYNLMGLPQEKAHVVYNIKLQSGKHFIITIKIEQQYCDSIFFPIINILGNKIRQTIILAQDYASELQKTLLGSSICILSKISEQKKHIAAKKVIEKFHHNFLCKNAGVVKMTSKIANIVLNRNIIYLNSFMINMKTIIRQYQRRVSENLQYLTYTLKKIYFAKLKDKINSKQLLKMNIIKGTKIIHQIEQTKIDRVFFELYKIAKTETHLNNRNKKQGGCILVQFLSRKVRSNCRSLFENYQDKKIQIKELIKLLGQQYELTNFPTLKGFLNFAQERLACGISQISHSSCLLKLGVNQFGTVYFSDLRQQQPLQQDFKKIEIKEVPNHSIVYYLRHKNLQIKLKAQQEWLLGLIKQGIIPAYCQYYKSMILKTKLMMRSLPNNKQYAYKLIKAKSIAKQLKVYKKTANEFQHICKLHKQVSENFKQIAAKENQIFQKTNNIKIIKDNILGLGKKKSELNVNYQMKSKTLAMHKLQLLLEKKRAVKKQQETQQSIQNTNQSIVEQFSNLPIKYFAYVEEIKNKKDTRINQGCRAFCIILKKIIQKKKQQAIKYGFARIWKITSFPQLHVNLVEVRPLQELR